MYKKNNKIHFPSSYKSAILKKTKSLTIRVDKEMNKYKAGSIYQAFSYKEVDWKIKIYIEKINKLEIKSLINFGIPVKSIKSLKRKTLLKDHDKVELIKFNYLA